MYGAMLTPEIRCHSMPRVAARELSKFYGNFEARLPPEKVPAESIHAAIIGERLCASTGTARSLSLDRSATVPWQHSLSTT